MPAPEEVPAGMLLMQATVIADIIMRNEDEADTLTVLTAVAGIILVGFDDDDQRKAAADKIASGALRLAGTLNERAKGDGL